MGRVEVPGPAAVAGRRRDVCYRDGMARLIARVNRFADFAYFAWRLGGVALMGVNVVAGDYISRHRMEVTWRVMYNDPTPEQLDRFARLDACAWMPWLLAGYALVGACAFARRGWAAVLWSANMAVVAALCGLFCGSMMF